MLCWVYLGELSDSLQQQREKTVRLTREIIFTLSSTAQSIKEIPMQRLSHPKTTCASSPAEKAIIKPSWRTVFSYQLKYILFSFFLRSRHGGIKSKVLKSSGVCWAITYALVIWLSCLWATCCATLPRLWNIKWIIAIDRQSICHYVKLGGGADGHSAS